MTTPQCPSRRVRVADRHDPEVRAWHAARAAHREGEEREATRERRVEFAQTISRAGRR